MKKTLSIALSATVLALSSASAFGASVGGNVNTRVATGVIIQQNTGIANKNEINLGSVSGRRASVGGNFYSNVRTGLILQKNTGIANKNELNIGSVTD